MSAPANIAEWLHSLPISWLTQRANGYADSTAQGQLYDGQVTLAKEAVKARMPLLAPSDALGHVGGDRQLIQGYAEPDDDFRIRCKTAFDQWALAGTWGELLYQLFFTCNIPAGSAYVVQQNGLAYYLTADPVAGEDPTPLVGIVELGLAYNITPPTGVPWWYFDSRDDLCSRFAIVFTDPLPGALQVTARAEFDGTSDTATATWSAPWDDASYIAMPAAPVTVDGSIPVVAVSEKSKTTATVQASLAFEGYVDLIGWIAGSNPFASPSLSMRNLINKLVKTWKPAKAKYMGAVMHVSGVLWGWPIGTTWGQVGLVWGDSLVGHLTP